MAVFRYKKYFTTSLGCIEKFTIFEPAIYHLRFKKQVKLNPKTPLICDSVKGVFKYNIMKYRILKSENNFYPQYYCVSWISFFNRWNFFKELSIGSFNPPESDCYENVSFNNIDEAKKYILDKNKPSIEIVYEN